MGWNEYSRTLDEIVSNADASGAAVLDVIQKLPQVELTALLAEVRLIKNESDIKEGQRFESIFGGFPTIKDPIERGLIYSVVVDAERRHTVSDLRKMCAQYVQEQPLFRALPELWERIRETPDGKKDFELVSTDDLEFVGDFSAVKYKNRFAFIPHYLPSQLLAWASTTLGTKFFVRLDPWNCLDVLPKTILKEIAVRPANPSWASDMRIYRGKKEGARHVLEKMDEPTEENKHLFWDFHTKGIRRLEISARREHDDHFSMMIEELSAKEEKSNIWLGRCIHLDSRDPIGTEFSKCRLDHIDLAMNVYMDETMLIREEQFLDEGKVVDASCRIHLLRYNNVPFSSLLEMSRYFFQSEALTEEWIVDQFPRT